MDPIIAKLETLREEAWKAVTESPRFEALKAIDLAITTLGGESILFQIKTTDAEMVKVGIASVALVGKATDLKPPVRRKLARHRRKPLSQSAAAMAVLKDAGEPLPIGRLMERAGMRGAQIGGKNPLSNFRSVISKDPRFKSLVRNNLYFWWFAGENPPSGWNETPGRDLLDGPGVSSVHSNQEGGGRLAATTT
jgi:hypothetical protein